MFRSRRELLRGNNWACRQSFGRPYLEHQPSEEQRVGKDDERTYRGNRVANLMAGMHQSYADCRDNRACDPYPNLRQRQPSRLNGRIQAIEDAKQEECDETQKIEMRMRRKGGMIARYRHLQAPDHSSDQQQYSCPET
jgi:hypothetical protein